MIWGTPHLRTPHNSSMSHDRAALPASSPCAVTSLSKDNRSRSGPVPRWLLHGLTCHIHMGIAQLCMYTLHIFTYVCIICIRIMYVFVLQTKECVFAPVDTQIPCFKMCPPPGQWQVLWRCGGQRLQRLRQLRHVAARRHRPWLCVAGRGLALQPAARRRSRSWSRGVTSTGEVVR